MTQPNAIVADEDGNFDSPALQSLQGVFDDYDQETVEEDEVLRVIGNVEAYVKAQIEEMETAAKSSNVDPHEPNRVAILDGFYDHLRGLEKMRAFFAGGEDELIDEGFELIQTATNQMVRGFQGLIEDAERLTPKICLKCSRENERDATYCRRCGVMLPVTSEVPEKRLLAVADDQPTPSDEPPETTPNYMEVADANESWRSGKSSDQQFLETLAGVRQRHLTQHEATLAYYGQAEQAGKPGYHLEHIEQVAKSIETNVEALEAMATAVEDGHKEGVQSAMTDLAEATIELLAAQKKADKSS